MPIWSGVIIKDYCLGRMPQDLSHHHDCTESWSRKYSNPHQFDENESKDQKAALSICKMINETIDVNDKNNENKNAGYMLSSDYRLLPKKKT